MIRSPAAVTWQFLKKQNEAIPFKDVLRHVRLVTSGFANVVKTGWSLDMGICIDIIDRYIRCLYINIYRYIMSVDAYTNICKDTKYIYA